MTAENMAGEKVNSPMLTKARMRGIIGGATILALFGSFWCFVSLASWAARPNWAIPLASVVITLLLCGCGVRLSQSATLPSGHDPIAKAKAKRDSKWFGIIFGVEGGLIALVCALLGRSGLGDWIPFAVALIVGVHFLPLAQVFEVPLYFWTGALSVIGVLACLLIHPTSLQVLCVGLVMAAVLWSTTAFLVIRIKSME